MTEKRTWGWRTIRLMLALVAASAVVGWVAAISLAHPGSTTMTAQVPPTALLAAATPATTATPPTTVEGIGGRLPAPVSTLPLATREPNAHIAPIWPELSGIGFALFLILVITQVVLTRPSRRGGHRTL